VEFIGTRGMGKSYRRRIVSLAGFACVCALLLHLVSANAAAQMNAGTILGTITDPTGAAIADAQVTVTNVGTSISQKTTTDATGNYVVPLPDTGCLRGDCRKGRLCGVYTEEEGETDDVR